eukprot:TRINITY_DN1350_c0_g1_i1.p2 TRINITY_DN1350_c0_g1~~TRINITY_DN1350_c0_g1_i1.p2  ORF type:complete len:231 (-),score=38.04 TRINITY_DN1350_c0_g1_i1:216-908(-)
MFAEINLDKLGAETNALLMDSHLSMSPEELSPTQKVKTKSSQRPRMTKPKTFQTSTSYDSLPQVPSDKLCIQNNNHDTSRTPPARKRTDFPVPETWSHLNGILTNETGLDHFRRYLRESEVAEENLLFHFRVENFKCLEGSQRIIEVKEMFEEFLKSGAQNELNLDGSVKREIEGVIAQSLSNDDVPPDIFEFVHRIIFGYLRESFLQFKLNPRWEALVDHYSSSCQTQR